MVMANTYFRFKQFIVHQDRSALKVSTDSCIFGAWVAKQRCELPVAGYTPAPGRALDIGAGTGLLMLMLAQQCNDTIDGVEIDRHSFEQASENIAASPWAARLQLFHGDIKSAALPAPYDFIISNPPFYEGDLHSPTLHKNMAKHDAGLTLEALLDAAGRLTASTGRLAVLLPWQRAGYFQQLAVARGWRVARQLLIRQTPQHNYFRAALLLEKNYAGKAVMEALTIHTAERVYTPEMETLLKPYYLHL
jgi:tRNA1Val (adenine37-N6)-methyltransferase